MDNTENNDIDIVNNDIVIKKNMSFKEQHSFEKRKTESERILAKYPDRIPIIVEKFNGKNDSKLDDINKKKFLAPPDITIGQFMYIIRNRLKLTEDKALFIFINKTLPATAATLNTIYENNKDDDGFLYVSYSSESTFGN